MENLSDALIMAGQVLIFIVALTICISSFTEVRTNINNLIGQTETVQMTKGTLGYINYIDSKEASATRLIGVETIVSSMYRAVKENYVIYIVVNDANLVKGSGDDVVDLVRAEHSLTINSKEVVALGKEIIKVTIGNETNQEVNAKLKNGFYEKIKNLSFYEYLGQYQNNTEVTTENKQTHRIITYIEQDYFDGLT